MGKILSFFKSNWHFLLVFFVVVSIFWEKIIDWFKSIFNPDARDEADDDSPSDYLGSQCEKENKGVKVCEDGLEYFYYGKKRVRLTVENKAVVANYCTVVFNYMASNTNSITDWILDDTLHFYTGEIQATLNHYLDWCQEQETWIHYFAYVFIQLHTVQFLDYLRASLDAEGYEATSHYVKPLSLFYY